MTEQADEVVDGLPLDPAERSRSLASASVYQVYTREGRYVGRIMLSLEQCRDLIAHDSRAMRLRPEALRKLGLKGPEKLRLLMQNSDLDGADGSVGSIGKGGR